MGDSKSTSNLGSLAKNDSKSSASEEKKVTSHGDIKSSQKSDTEESFSSESTTASRRKTVRKQRKDEPDDEAPESTSKNKKKKMKEGEPPYEESSEPSETQKQKKTEAESSKKDRIKAFASKGAAARSATSIDQITENVSKDKGRSVKSIVIESIIRPSDEPIDEHQHVKTSSETKIEQPLPEKRKSQIMLEEMIQKEEEDQALATLVIDLLKKKKRESLEKAKFRLSEAEIYRRSKSMSLLEQAGIICVLEETIAKLSVLGYTHGKPIVQQKIKYISLLDKLAEKEHSELIDLIKSNKSVEEFENEKQFIKLQNDRAFLEEALILTLLEMEKMGSFKILQDIIHLEQEMIKEEADLRFEGKNRQQEVNHCKALMERDYSRGMRKLEDRTSLLAILKDEIQNLLYYNGLKFKYLDHWESSRAEQNTMVLQNKENGLNKKLSDYEELISMELRCNAEIKAFFEEDIKNLSNTVEEWMNRYDSEMEERESQLTKLKEEREEHLKKLKEKTKLFNERQSQIDEYKAYKEKLRLEAEYKAKLIRMATRIQAWWRGTMVRRHLGPYKKKRKKRRKKK